VVAGQTGASGMDRTRGSHAVTPEQMPHVQPMRSLWWLVWWAW
jgi:hypothetical protein